jgi:hypothetical protein
MCAADDLLLAGTSHKVHTSPLEVALTRGLRCEAPQTSAMAPLVQLGKTLKA